MRDASLLAEPREHIVAVGIGNLYDSTGVGTTVIRPNLLTVKIVGTGTYVCSAVAAAKNGRRWIGIDANSDFCDLATARMEIELGCEGDA